MQSLAGTRFVTGLSRPTRQPFETREKIKVEDLFPAADVTETAEGPEYRVLSLDALVRMKLTSFRAKDQTHLDDLLRVGLIDESWLNRVPPELAGRLQQVIDAFEPDPDNLLDEAE